MPYLLQQLPHLAKSYETWSPELQSSILSSLIKKSRKSTLQLASSLIHPILKRDFLASLPYELRLQIISYLDVQSLCEASRVSKIWNVLIDYDQQTWYRLLLQDGFVIPTTTSTKTTTDNLSFHITSSQTNAPTTTSSPLSALQLSPHEHLNKHHHHSFIDYKSAYRSQYVLKMNWKYGRFKRTAFAGHTDNIVTSLQFDEHKIVSGATDSLINVYSTKDPQRQRFTLSGHDGGVWALQYVGNTLVSGSVDRTVRVWDLSKRKCTHVFKGHTSTVRCLLIVMPVVTSSGKKEPSEPLIVTGARDSSIRVWRLPELDNESQVEFTKGDEIISDTVLTHTNIANHNSTADGEGEEEMEIGPEEDNNDEGDDELVMNDENRDPSTNNDNNDENLFVGEGTNPWFKFLMVGHTNSVRSIAAYGNTLISGSYDNTVGVWSLDTGRLLHRMEGHTSNVYSVVIDPPRQQCMSGSMDSVVYIWDYMTGECLHKLDGHSILVGLLGLTPNYLVSAAADRTLRVWDPNTGVCEHVLSGKHGHEGAITCFKHDEEKVISGSEGGLKIWDIKTGKFMYDLVTGVKGVWWLTFNRSKCVVSVHE
ncbi:WD40-repeat-containing domain protein [Mycotypha africana]|uniref:WD40-repeat-containing domain protein n=1 Tax=Mycotypha africana TaxID=64632 RepID=UPI002300761A|nr:WD40-repeat-containing domain protein [Mycotypha africana]KAI8984779.1 WD40-repeat-containing domain protein [Mycotypha africana]